MKTIKLSKSKGFTLIELMITVAIVGILATVGFASYQDYMIKTQVAEGFELSRAAILAETEYYHNNGNFTYVENIIGQQSAGKYVSAVYTAGFPPGDPFFGIRVSYQQPAANAKIREGGSVTFHPIIDANGTIRWACYPDGIYIVKKYMPASCDTNFYNN